MQYIPERNARQYYEKKEKSQTIVSLFYVYRYHRFLHPPPSLASNFPLTLFFSSSFHLDATSVEYLAHKFSVQLQLRFPSDHRLLSALDHPIQI